MLRNVKSLPLSLRKRYVWGSSSRDSSSRRLTEDKEERIGKPKGHKRRNYLDREAEIESYPREATSSSTEARLLFTASPTAASSSSSQFLKKKRFHYFRQLELRWSIYLLRNARSTLCYYGYYYYLKMVALSSYLLPVGNQILFFSRAVTTDCPPEEKNSEPERRELFCVGRSALHGRGVFALSAAPKGTRVVLLPPNSNEADDTKHSVRKYFIFSKYFLKFSLDFQKDSQKLPELFYYGFPSGNVLGLTSLRLSLCDSLLNHSCQPNARSGFSSFFQNEILSYSYYPLSGEEMSALVTSFGNPNEFYLTQDVAAGEEITINYHHRQAPMAYDSLYRQLFPSSKDSPLPHRKKSGSTVWSSLVQSCQTLLTSSATASSEARYLCRCGERNCRHFLFQFSSEELELIRHYYWLYTRFQSTSSPTEEGKQEMEGRRFRNRREIEVELLFRLITEHLFDDEITLLSLTPSSTLLLEYLNCYSSRMDSDKTTQKEANKSDLKIDFFSISKRELIQHYRHAFQIINELKPTDLKKETQDIKED